MVKRSDYPQDAVEICLSVLVEFMTIVGAYKEDVVLIGGWVPYFLFEKYKQEHTGSLDIDVALDFKHIDEQGYKSILKLLKEKGYSQGDSDYFQFLSLEKFYQWAAEEKAKRNIKQAEQAVVKSEAQVEPVPAA